MSQDNTQNFTQKKIAEINDDLAFIAKIGDHIKLRLYDVSNPELESCINQQIESFHNKEVINELPTLHTSEIEQHPSTIETLMNENIELTKEYEQCQKQKDGQMKVRDNVLSKFGKLLGSHEKLKVKEEIYEKAIDLLRKDKKNLEEIDVFMEELEQQKTKLKKELDEATEEFNKLSGRENDVTNQYESLKKEYDTEKMKNEDKNKKKLELENETEYLKKECDRKQQEIDKLTISIADNITADVLGYRDLTFQSVNDKTDEEQIEYDKIKKEKEQAQECLNQKEKDKKGIEETIKAKDDSLCQLQTQKNQLESLIESSKHADLKEQKDSLAEPSTNEKEEKIKQSKEMTQEKKLDEEMEKRTNELPEHIQGNVDFKPLPDDITPIENKSTSSESEISNIIEQLKTKTTFNFEGLSDLLKSIYNGFDTDIKGTMESIENIMYHMNLSDWEPETEPKVIDQQLELAKKKEEEKELEDSIDALRNQEKQEESSGLVDDSKIIEQTELKRKSEEDEIEKEINEFKRKSEELRNNNKELQELIDSTNKSDEIEKEINESKKILEEIERFEEKANEFLSKKDGYEKYLEDQKKCSEDNKNLLNELYDVINLVDDDRNPTIAVERVKRWIEDYEVLTKSHKDFVEKIAPLESSKELVMKALKNVVAKDQLKKEQESQLKSNKPETTE
ncbi:hypothetical protein QTN25_006699 [Entamoeba marina]